MNHTPNQRNRDLNSQKIEQLHRYLTRYGLDYSDVLPDPLPSLEAIVVIPSYKETGLNDTIRSLLDSAHPDYPMEIIPVINHPAGSPESVVEINQKSLEEVRELSRKAPPNVSLHPLWIPDLPIKHAGVGLARKIGFDTAVARFLKVGNPQGILISFDADTYCQVDFIPSVLAFYSQYPKARCCNHYFEHLLHDSIPGDLLQSIAAYELHLRYFKLALEWCGHPYAIHTVGSAFSMRAHAYVQSGGMGRHQAGEDFYFLQKMVSLGQFYEHPDARVFPGTRISDRVPFGTGAAMGLLAQTGRTMETYPFDLFSPVRSFVHSVQTLNQIPSGFSADQPLYRYLADEGFDKEWNRLAQSSGSISSFKRHFFHAFGIFPIIQFLNQEEKCRGGRMPVLQESWKLAKELSIPLANSVMDQLVLFRMLEKNRGLHRIT